MEVYLLDRKVIKKMIIAICMLMISMAVSVAFKSKGVFLNKERKLPIYSVGTEEKKVSITFDVNWGENNTIEILDILDKYNVKATFFLIGNWIDDFPEEVKEIHKRGHEIGNHSNSHPDMSKISKEKMINELSVTDAKTIKVIGESTRLFRFPSGSYNNLSVETVNELGYHCIQWDVDSIDWRAEGEEKEYNRVMKNTKPGSILLFHTDGKYTPKTLPRIIEDLKAKGYEFVKVGDLIHKDNYNIDHQGRQIKQ
ncbi:MAG: polysaccharide deacetylase family sporulation protein PdaB [Clostridiaceae bacterium]